MNYSIKSIKIGLNDIEIEVNSYLFELWLIWSFSDGFGLDAAMECAWKKKIWLNIIAGKEVATSEIK